MIPTTEGTHVVGDVTIEKVLTKGDWSRFFIEGSDRKIVIKTADLEPNGIKEGAKINLTVNNKAGKDREGNNEITSWFGKPKGSFGGGRAFTPKSKEEIHSASLCGLIKSAIESRKDDWKTVATEAIEVYAEGLKKVIG